MLRHEQEAPKKKAPTNNPGLVWLSPTSSHDEQRKAAKRLIWSRAAIHSHSIAPRTRKPSANKAPGQKRGPYRIKKRDVAQRDLPVLTKKVQDANEPRVVEANENDPSDPVVVASNTITTAPITKETGSTTLSALARRTQRLPSPLLLDASSRDPFASTKVKPEPWYGWLADFWYNYVIPKSSRPIKVSVDQLHAYQIWSRRLELTEPALHYMSLFMATGIPVAEGRMPLIQALWLRDQTVRAINEALRDPERALSNAVILAVGRIALHEHVYGDRWSATHLHRPALARMIELRGGIEAMGLPTVTVQLMIWCDAFMSAEANTPTYLADKYKHPKVVTYSPDEAMSVVKTCSPQRSAHPGYNSAAPAMENASGGTTTPEMGSGETTPSEEALRTPGSVEELGE